MRLKALALCCRGRGRRWWKSHATTKEGKAWNRQEFEAAKANPQFFGEALKQMGRQIGEKDNEEIYRNMGLNARDKKAEGERAALDAKIDVNVNGLSENLASQVTNQLFPKINALVAQIGQQLEIKMDKNRQEAAAQRAATTVN